MKPADVAALFQPGGRLAALPGYEHRPDQARLAAWVGALLNGHGFAQVESPPGSGKTLAYLVPAAIAARERGLPSVVATATLALQDQIANHDFPKLRALVPGTRLAVLKGRRHYVCPPRLRLLPRGPTRASTEASLKRGATTRLDFDANVQTVWEIIHAGRCLTRCERCPLREAREQAAEAQIVVVNHALLAADTEQQVVPEFGAIIVDEAHRLVDAFTSALSRNIAQRHLDALVSLHPLPPREQAATHGAARAVAELLATCARALGPVSGSDGRVTIEPSGETWEKLVNGYKRLAPSLSQLHQQLEEVKPARTASSRVEFQRDLDQVTELLVSLGAFFLFPGEGIVRWVDVNAPSLHLAPLDVGPQLQRQLWSKASAGLLISATLRTPLGFDFQQFGLPATSPTLTLASPFDFPRQCLLACPEVAAPGAPEHAGDVAQVAAALARGFGGRTLVLLTSYAELRAVDAHLRGLLSGSDLTVLAQGRDGERTELLERFRAGGSVLLGTNTFWEGIDLVGDALQALVVAKLPFDVPTDPLHTARSQLYPRPFLDYTVARTAIRLRQGIGRLIRSRSDRGVAVILDPRLRTKPYGKLIAATLPRCALYTGELAQLPEVAARFVTGEHARQSCQPAVVGAI